MHRVGRTARAGAVGLSYALVEPQQAHHFRLLLADTVAPDVGFHTDDATKPSRSTTGVKQESVLPSVLAGYAPRYAAVMAALAQAVEQEAKGQLPASQPLPPLPLKGDAVLPVIEVSQTAPAPAVLPATTESSYAADEATDELGAPAALEDATEVPVQEEHQKHKKKHKKKSKHKHRDEE